MSLMPFVDPMWGLGTMDTPAPWAMETFNPWALDSMMGRYSTFHSLLRFSVISNLMQSTHIRDPDFNRALKKNRRTMKQFSPILSTDLIESENDYHLHCDLPGAQIA